jgi:hypothetical protein
VSVEVVATRRAQQQITALDRTHERAFAGFLDDLALNGCAALAYRLTGPVPLSRLCVKHLRGALRVVVAFESPQRACVLLVGPHDTADPGLHVYGELYELLGTAPPEGAGRTKPPCCDDGGQPPPGLGDELADLIVSAAKQRKTRRRR